MTRRFKATVERCGFGWRVSIAGLGGAAGVQAQDLSDVEARARKLVWSYTGINPADFALDVDVRLPPAIQLRLDLAAQLCLESSSEVEGASDDMLEARLAVRDVSYLLRTRCRMPRPFTITNAEVARWGLTNHPLARGLKWDDHARFLTVTCRDCVEYNRQTYLDLDEEDENVLIYGRPFACDSCEERFPELPG
ncbi:MAG TPA: hypothetical protein VGJ86_18090 [Acidimicrobiales bacterium]